MDISGNSITSMLNESAGAASSVKSSSLSNSLNKLNANSSEEELKGAIKDFESYMVEQVLKEVKDSVMSDEEEDSTMSQHKDMFMDKAIELVADELVEQVGETVTQQLYEQMKRNITI